MREQAFVSRLLSMVLCLITLALGHSLAIAQSPPIFSASPASGLGVVRGADASSPQGACANALAADQSVSPYWASSRYEPVNESDAALPDGFGWCIITSTAGVDFYTNIGARCVSSDNAGLHAQPFRCVCEGATEYINGVCQLMPRCPVGQHFNALGVCVPDKKDDTCGVGNPILPGSGSKTESKVDYRATSSSPLAFGRSYNSSGSFSYLDGFGRYWHGSLSARIHTGADAWIQNAYDGSAIAVAMPDGAYIKFTQDTSGNWPYPYKAVSPSADLVELVRLGYPDAHYRWRANKEGAFYLFAMSDGSLQRIVRMDGKTLTLEYASLFPGTPKLLTRAVDDFGRQLTFSYVPDGILREVRLPGYDANAALKITYEMDDVAYMSPNVLSQGRLRKVIYPDGTSVSYLYSDGRFPMALTGIVDELGVQVSSFQYDADGFATSTQSGLGTFALSGRSATQVTVTDPIGSQRQLTLGQFGERVRLTGSSQPAGSGCAASTQSISYDAVDNKASEDDFKGFRTCYAYDTARNLETVRVEGLANSQSCGSVSPAGSTLPSGSRKTSTQWHPDWRLPIRVAQPGVRTTYVYNGQPDPLNGNTVASCAPAAALLPDGKPIVVLCRQVEQSTTDTNGSQGFNASLEVGVANREQRWTYNQYGQVLTHDGPRTDVNDLTTYAYYASSTADYTMGDLQSVTNAVGLTTQYTKYDKDGQLLESIDANGTVTTNVYDLRQRLLSTTVAGETTSSTFDAAGQLLRRTNADGSYVGYEYDATHRQTAVFDGLGNRIEYTLDGAGNRTAETVKDPGGNLRRMLTRAFDALGRVQQTTGRE